MRGPTAARSTASASFRSSTGRRVDSGSAAGASVALIEDVAKAVRETNCAAPVVKVLHDTFGVKRVELSYLHEARLSERTTLRTKLFAVDADSCMTLFKLPETIISPLPRILPSGKNGVTRRIVG